MVHQRPMPHNMSEGMSMNMYLRRLKEGTKKGAGQADSTHKNRVQDLLETSYTSGVSTFLSFVGLKVRQCVWCLTTSVR